MAVNKRMKATKTVDSNNYADKATVFTQIRIDEDTFLKGKILASVYDLSFNAFMIRAIKDQIRQYEIQHGDLPKPIKLEEDEL